MRALAWLLVSHWRAGCICVCVFSPDAARRHRPAAQFRHFGRFLCAKSLQVSMPRSPVVTAVRFSSSLMLVWVCAACLRGARPASTFVSMKTASFALKTLQLLSFKDIRAQPVSLTCISLRADTGHSGGEGGVQVAPERGLPPQHSAGPSTALQENSAGELEHCCGAQLGRCLRLLGLLQAHGQGQRPGCGIAGRSREKRFVRGGGILPSCHSQGHISQAHAVTGHFHTASPPRDQSSRFHSGPLVGKSHLVLSCLSS